MSCINFITWFSWRGYVIRNMLWNKRILEQSIRIKKLKYLQAAPGFHTFNLNMLVCLCSRLELTLFRPIWFCLNRRCSVLPGVLTKISLHGVIASAPWSHLILKSTNRKLAIENIADLTGCVSQVSSESLRGCCVQAVPSTHTHHNPASVLIPWRRRAVLCVFNLIF